MLLYDPGKETITSTMTGEVIHLYTGEKLDQIGSLLAMAVFDPSQTQKAYINLLKLFQGK